MTSQNKLYHGPKYCKALFINNMKVLASLHLFIIVGCLFLGGCNMGYRYQYDLRTRQGVTEVELEQLEERLVAYFAKTRLDLAIVDGGLSLATSEPINTDTLRMLCEDTVQLKIAETYSELTCEAVTELNLPYYSLSYGVCCIKHTDSTGTVLKQFLRERIPPVFEEIIYVEAGKDSSFYMFGKFHVFRNPYSKEIVEHNLITLDLAGKDQELLRKITQENIRKIIIVAVNDTGYYCPTVMSEIPGNIITLMLPEPKKNLFFSLFKAPRLSIKIDDIKYRELKD